MKIALATWFPHDPAKPRGGVEAVSVNLARALAAIPGNQVHVVTFDPAIAEPECIHWEGAVIHRLPLSQGSLFTFAKDGGRQTLGEFLRKLGPDVVHAHDTFGIMTRGLDLPRVFTIHGFIHEDTRYAGGMKARLRSLLWKREEMAAWAEQPHIVAISPYVRERLRRIARGVIYDVANPIDSGCFEIAREEVSANIFSAAVIAPRKNQLGLSHAVAAIQLNIPIALRLAGSATDSGYSREIEAFSRNPASGDRILLLGNLTSPQVKRELAKAAVFALVSFEEGAPMGIAEAMAAGLPVVTSNRCGMPYMVRHGETGFLVNPHRPEEIGARLGELLTNPGLRHEMGQAGRVFAVEHFHPDKVAARTMRVYADAVR